MVTQKDQPAWISSDATVHSKPMIYTIPERKFDLKLVNGSSDKMYAVVEVTLASTLTPGTLVATWRPISGFDWSQHYVPQVDRLELAAMCAEVFGKASMVNVSK